MLSASAVALIFVMTVANLKSRISASFFSNAFWCHLSCRRKLRSVSWCCALGVLACYSGVTKTWNTECVGGQTYGTEQSCWESRMLKVRSKNEVWIKKNWKYVEEMNKVGIKVKSMNNNERHIKKLRMKNKQLKHEWVKHRLICSQIRNQSICYIVHDY
jgi:hypothetical protein